MKLWCRKWGNAEVNQPSRTFLFSSLCELDVTFVAQLVKNSDECRAIWKTFPFVNTLKLLILISECWSKYLPLKVLSWRAEKLILLPDSIIELHCTTDGKFNINAMNHLFVVFKSAVRKPHSTYILCTYKYGGAVIY